MGIAVFVVCFVAIFVPLQRAMIRSARSTSEFTDPAMRSVVGALAERSMTVRYVVGTIGVLMGTMIATMIVSGIISAVFGIPFME
jgi:hypothetical protein